MDNQRLVLPTYLGHLDPHTGDWPAQRRSTPPEDRQPASVCPPEDRGSGTAACGGGVAPVHVARSPTTCSGPQAREGASQALTEALWSMPARQPAAQPARRQAGELRLVPKHEFVAYYRKKFRVDLSNSLSSVGTAQEAVRACARERYPLTGEWLDTETRPGGGVTSKTRVYVVRLGTFGTRVS